MGYIMSNYVSEDLMFEIFTRLPVKSLLRFRSLSKSICYFIGSPEFICIHTFRSPQKVFIRHCYMIEEEEEKEEDVEEEEEEEKEYFITIHLEDRLPLCPINGYNGITPIRFPSGYFEIVGSPCNGILCLFDRPQFRFILWNPSIRRKLTIADHPWKFKNKTFRVALGFGFDPITQDYKIVTISFPDYGKRNVDISFLVYSMKTNTWCEIDSPTNMFTYVTSRACYVNGTLHWVVGDCLNESDEIEHCYIMTFDLSTHIFGKIKMPGPSRNTDICLTTIKGSLAVVLAGRDLGWIWLMEENDTWSLVFKFEINRVEGEICTVFQLTNGNYVLKYTIPPRSLLSGWCRVYNPNTGTRLALVGFNEDCEVLDTKMYVESLELLGTGSVCEGNQPSFLRELE